MNEKMMIKLKKRILKLKIHELILSITVVVFISTVRYKFSIENLDLLSSITASSFGIFFSWVGQDILLVWLEQKGLNISLGEIMWGHQYLGGIDDDTIKCVKKKEIKFKDKFLMADDNQNRNQGVPATPGRPQTPNSAAVIGRPIPGMPLDSFTNPPVSFPLYSSGNNSTGYHSSTVERGGNSPDSGMQADETRPTLPSVRDILGQGFGQGGTGIQTPNMQADETRPTLPSLRDMDIPNPSINGRVIPWSDPTVNLPHITNVPPNGYRSFFGEVRLMNPNGHWELDTNRYRFSHDFNNAMRVYERWSVNIIMRDYDNLTHSVLTIGNRRLHIVLHPSEVCALKMAAKSEAIFTPRTRELLRGLGTGADLTVGVTETPAKINPNDLEVISRELSAGRNTMFHFLMNRPV